MRGDDLQQDQLYSYVSPEQRVPSDHPLRAIRQMTNTVLERLSRQFDQLYSGVGRPSIPPEKLLRALLLQVLYTIRSERLLMEELDYITVVPLVCGLEHGRCGLGCDGVFEESGATAERAGGRGLFPRGPEDGERARSAE
jgi:hypothetical protein